MACIGCHDWGEYKSLGEEGPQLVNVAERMRWDWFQRWMRNPARILSGTSMPNYFGASYASPKAADQIATLWAGLELGKAAVPDGYRTADLDAGGESKPVPGKESIVIRWDMPEATPAAIAVGLPGGKLSYCFDAGRSQVLYAWSGGFIDMTETLLKKTDKNKMTPTAAIVGAVIYRNLDFPIRAGDRDRLPQRRFRGYRLIDGIPEFHYTVDGIDVYERLSPVPGEQSIRRELRFGKVEGPVWFEGREVPRGPDVKVETKLAK